MTEQSNDVVKVWGAAPSHWKLFEGLGLLADLLPTVCDPDVPISPNSRLKSVYKTPGLINRAGMAVGLPKWTARRTRAADVQRWASDNRLGICLQTRDVRAIDIDIEDKAEVAKIVAGVRERLGVELPMRWRENSNKCLLMLRVEGPQRKAVVNTHHGAVEFLGDGQQFVAVGTHKSGAPYLWDGREQRQGQLAPVRWGLVGLPVVDARAYKELQRWLGEEFGVVPTEWLGGGFGEGEHNDAMIAADPVRTWLLEGGQQWTTFEDGVHHYEGGKLDVRCPFESEHTSGEPGDNSTVYIPQGYRGVSRGVVSCSHAHCAGRGAQDFLDAMGYAGGGAGAEEFEVLEVSAPRLVHRKTGKNPGLMPYLPTATNLRIALQRPEWLGVGLRYDLFELELTMYRPEVVMDGAIDAADLGLEPGVEVFVDDARKTAIDRALETRGIDVGRAGVAMSTLMAAAEQVDSAKDWLQGLRWDGVERVKHFAREYLAGKGDADYLDAVSLYAWTAMAGRIMEPGCKADMAPLMVSGEGTGKSTAVLDMAPWPGAFAEVSLHLDDREIAMALAGVAVAELPEMTGMDRRGTEALKALVTRRVDQYRAPYAVSQTRAPRRAIFWGTTNKLDILGANTGQRRWLPFEVGRMPWGKVKEDREQLWAEALQLWRQHGVMQADAERLAVAQRERFTAELHPASEVLRRALVDGEDFTGLTVPFTLDEAVQELGSRYRLSPNKLGQLLRDMGLVRTEARPQMLADLGASEERIEALMAGRATRKVRVWHWPLEEGSEGA